MYVNDMTGSVDCESRPTVIGLLANDTIIFRPITKASDIGVVQKQLANRLHLGLFLNGLKNGN